MQAGGACLWRCAVGLVDEVAAEEGVAGVVAPAMCPVQECG